MANNYYNFGGPFIPSTKVRSGQVNPEFAGVESGFDLLPSASDSIPRGVVELGIDVQGGTVNEYDVGMPDTRLTNQEGDLVVFRATHTNDGPAVINVDTIGDIAAVEFDGSAFAGGELVTGRVYEFRYDNANTQFVLSQSTDGANQVISAQDWAIRPEDDPVPVSSGGDGSTTFSALHWSAKSAQFGGGLDFAGDHDGTSGDPATPASGNPLYRIITGAGVITGAGTVEVGDDIYWNGVDWNRINNQEASAVTQGTSADDPTSPGSFDAQFQWQNVNGDPLANVGFNTGQSFDINNVVHGGGLRLRGENGAGSLESYFAGTAGSSIQLFFAGVQKFATAVAGVIINDSTTNDPTAGLAQAALINIRNGSFATVADFGFITSSTLLSVKNFVHGGFVDILAEDATGVERQLFSGDPDGVTQIFHNTPVASEVHMATNNLGITVTNSITGPTTIVELVRGSDGAIVGELFHSAGEFAVEAGIDIEALMNLYATDTALNEVIMATFDAQSGFSQLRFSDGAGTTEVALATTALGIDVRGASGVVPTLTLTEASTVLATLDHEIIASGTDFLRLRNEANSGHVQIRGRSSSGGDALMLNLDPDNQVTIYWDENQRFRTAQLGIEIIGTGATSSTSRWFQSNGTSLMGTFSFGSSTHQWAGLVDGAAMELSSNDAGSVARLLFRADPDNTAAIYHAGLVRLITRADGVQVQGAGTNDPLAGGTQDLNLRFMNDTPAEIGSLQWNSSIDMVLANNVDGGEIQLTARQATGGVRELINMDPDADISLFFDGSEVARTITAATGGFEANNTLTGAGFERVLTTSDLGLFVTDVEAADTNLPDATPITVLSVTLEANTSYAVDFYLEVLADATDNFRFTVNDPGGATWNANGLVIASSEASPLNMDTISFIMNITGQASVIGISGTMNMVTDGNAGALTLDASKQSDASVDGTFRLGSWIRAQKLD